MTAISEYQERIRKFVIEKLASGRNINQVGNQHNLIEDGIIDSMGIMQLVSFIENAFAMKVNDEDIIPENFESIAGISSYIETVKSAAREN